MGASQVGSAGFAALGLPPAVGSKLGSTAAQYVSKVIGLGDYKVNQNSLVTGNSPPVFSQNGRAVIISHREFISDITSSATFHSDTYNINPGDADTFPWLSAVAQNFSQYKFHGLLFSFESRSATAVSSTNTALGTVILATQYNTNERTFTNKQEMENAEYSSAACPSESVLHPVECDPKESVLEHLYIKRPDTSGTEDDRFYNLGKMSIATVGVQAASNIGELWVTYEVELLKPILTPESYASALWAHQRITSYTNTDILGPIIAANDGNMEMSVTATGGGFDTFSFPPNLATGTFLMLFQWTGSSTAGVTASVAATNGSFLTVFSNDTANTISNSSTTSSKFLFGRVFRISAPGAKLTFSAATLPTSGTFGDIFIAQVGASVGSIREPFRRNIPDEMLAEFAKYIHIDN